MTLPLQIYVVLGLLSVLVELIAQVRARMTGLALSPTPIRYWVAQFLGYPVEGMCLVVNALGYSGLLAAYYEAVGAPTLVFVCSTCGESLCDDCGRCHTCLTHDDDDPYLTF